MFDITPLLHPADPWPAAEPAADVLANYHFKFAVAQLLRPRRILEFGVRYGYSAAAFLAGSPGAEYHGLDADNGGHGGVRGAYLEAAAMLRAKFPASRVTVSKVDTQREEAAVGAGWDLIHVDADHTHGGCLNDLRLAATLETQWILVDDIDFIPAVAAAVRDFLAETGFPHLYFPSFRGDCLIRSADRRP